MKHNFCIECNRIILRPLEENDIEALRILRNKERQWFMNSAEISCADQKGWYQNYLKKTDDLMFKVARKEEPEEFLGAVALYNVDLDAKQAESGRIVVDKERMPERGIGAEATAAVCHFGFEELRLNKIVAEVLKTNSRSLRMHENVGFQVTRETPDLFFMELVLQKYKG